MSTQKSDCVLSGHRTQPVLTWSNTSRVGSTTLLLVCNWYLARGFAQHLTHWKKRREENPPFPFILRPPPRRLRLHRSWTLYSPETCMRKGLFLCYSVESRRRRRRDACFCGSPFSFLPPAISVWKELSHCPWYPGQQGYGVWIILPTPTHKKRSTGCVKSKEGSMKVCW